MPDFELTTMPKPWTNSADVSLVTQAAESSAAAIELVRAALPEGHVVGSVRRVD